LPNQEIQRIGPKAGLPLISSLGAKKYEQRNGEEIVTFHIPSSAVQGNLFSDFKSPTTTQNMLDPASYTGLAGFHKYWGKKPIESIAYLIENLTEEGDVVMDPFLGSGLVAIECLSRNRKFLGIDINPFSIEHTSFLLSLPRAQDYYNALRKIGLPVELTYLKQQARSIDIDFDKMASPSDVYYEITEKLKDNGSKAALTVLDKVRNETMTILSEVRAEPKKLARWLYENQGEMRFGSENRLFLVLVDTNDFSGSWKLKRNLDLLKPAIQKYLNDFAKMDVSDLKVSFNYKGKPQVFTALTDVLFVVK
jgi:hypothetical protein